MESTEPRLLASSSARDSPPSEEYSLLEFDGLYNEYIASCDILCAKLPILLEVSIFRLIETFSSIQGIPYVGN